MGVSGADPAETLTETVWNRLATIGRGSILYYGILERGK